MARRSPSSAAANAESVFPRAQSQARTQSKKKRNNDPGVRTKGSRTYDSANGTTCHQCRQKTRDFTAVCKNWKVNRQCRIKFCVKCLENRYGEKAEVVALLSDWNCPKCRGICNCSFCMKKRGQRPTGILVHAAKKSGFSSVSEMLNIGVDDNLNDANSGRKGSKRPRISKESSGNQAGIDEMHGDVSLKKDDSSELDLSERYARCEASIGVQSDLRNVAEEIHHEEVQSDIALPEGSDLKTVAGVDLPSESVGHALQFLEFCASFGKALELRKGRAESVLLEVIQGQDRRRCQYSSTVQLHVQLLTLIQEDLGEESPSSSSADESLSSIPTDGGNSWLEGFRKRISESEVPMEALPVNLDRYADLDRSKKLRLLNFLCDEALGTDYLRDSIDDQNTTFAEKKKETPDLLLQDLRTCDAIASKEEKWITYDAQQKSEVENYISAKNLKSPKRKHKQEAAYPVLATQSRE